VNLHCLALACIYGPRAQLAVLRLDAESAGKPLFGRKVFGSGSAFLMEGLEAFPLPLRSCSKAFSSGFGLESQNFIKENSGME